MKPTMPTLDARLEALARRFDWRQSGAGVAAGEQRGPAFGTSGEFEGYRAFESRDDVRHLDLKIYARLAKRVVRVAREDRSLPITLLIDRSRSMLGGDNALDGVRRPTRTLELAGFVTHLCRQRHDALRVYTFGDGDLERFAPKGGAWTAAQLEGACRRADDGHSDFAASFARLTASQHGRGFAIVISDAWGIREPDRELASLARVGRPFWLAPLEAQELAPTTSRGTVRLHSREREASWTGAIDDDTKLTYRRQLAGYHESIARRLEAWGGALFVLPLSNSLEHNLLSIRNRRRLLKCVVR